MITGVTGREGAGGERERGGEDGTAGPAAAVEKGD